MWIGDPAEIEAQRVKKRKIDREDARPPLKLVRRIDLQPPTKAS
jgi:hypothetical protein